jgi:hypothetical protein
MMTEPSEWQNSETCPENLRKRFLYSATFWLSKCATALISLPPPKKSRCVRH